MTPRAVNDDPDAGWSTTLCAPEIKKVAIYCKEPTIKRGSLLVGRPGSMEKTGREVPLPVPLHEVKRGTLRNLVGTVGLPQIIWQRCSDSRDPQHCSV